MKFYAKYEFILGDHKLCVIMIFIGTLCHLCNIEYAHH
jgi:hypothetical protein